MQRMSEWPEWRRRAVSVVLSVLLVALAIVAVETIDSDRPARSLQSLKAANGFARRTLGDAGNHAVRPMPTQSPTMKSGETPISSPEMHLSSPTRSAPLADRPTLLASLAGSPQFTLSGGITPAFSPGVSHPIDLRVSNPNSAAITIESGAIEIMLSTSRAGCPASTNFEVTRGLTAQVTVPGNTAASLSELGIAATDWPIITMLDTNVDQDACEGALLAFHYAGSAVG